jgi:pimeloyl-ACP methyl ester carboxylesterase
MILNVIERGPDGPNGRFPLALLHGLYGQAGNFGVVQRRLAAKRRVLAVDLRNHGASPHAPGMSYADMAADVLETLRARAALPCAVLGHSMGGKVAMRAALDQPQTVARLVVADIAPVAYDHTVSHADYLTTMQAIPLHPGLTRAAADAVLAEAVPSAELRSFLLLNLRFGGAAPHWKLGLAEIAAALDELTGWSAVPGATYDGPTLFLSGGRSDYVRPEHRSLIRALFPQARFAVLDQAGHWLHAEDPAGFLAAVEGFLGEG